MSELLKKLVSIQSESENEEKAVDFLVQRMHEMGFKARKDRAGNAIGIAGTGKRKIVLAGHIDTVAGKLKVKESKGFLFGRGTVDAKGALSAFVETGAEFSDSNEVQVIVVGCVGEESDSKGAHFLVKGLKPYACVVGEPSGVNAITVGYRGRIYLEYSVRKNVFHSGHEEENANDIAVDFYNRLRKKFDGGEVSFNNSNVSLKEINSKSDGLVEECIAGIDLRTNLEFDSKAFNSFLKVEGKKKGVRVKVLEELPAVRSDKNSEIARAFISAIREHKLEAKYKVKTGSCDMNIFAEEWKCPVIAYGAGDSKLDHTNKEKISLEEYEKSKRVLVSALKRL